MRAPISVIVPTVDAAGDLPACLAALGEGLSLGLIRELVISDGGSVDGTQGVAEAAGALLVTGPPSRGGQLRRGAEAAQGDWLLFLHADTVLAPGWSDAVLPVIAAPGAYHFRLHFDVPGFAPRLVAGWANLRSRLFHLPYGDQGLLIHRALYDAVGGYPDIPLMEDVALARRLGRKLGPLAARAITSAEKYRAQGWTRRGGRNLLTLGRYLAGADPAILARAYRR
ncbi:TIGR04283 family arsenosugar biosynthesis glycosyltransferase [Thalassococcus sp. CAU 1522]|uniref:TIGR04283 family arsenosugar biosynthesis glycosyltransferase n=1 Tax=Thalassococcus arenae TaxID=2851652 RepID=A0ABS6N479_9RHOB|nr:TIGR04283 family arsenosugar biosynthesis glycosyltransferase [Thalassococcus arenae]MBV2358588.1 TIGR04283 family arsenosugar biosynthesis glycosyltransferase [Thalassococcus arenae]